MKEYLPYAIMALVAIVVGLFKAKSGPDWRKEADDAQEKLRKERVARDRAAVDAAVREANAELRDGIEKPTAKERIQWVLADSIDELRRKFGR